MKEVPDLNEYRNERIKEVTEFILETVQAHLNDRLDGDFSAVLGKKEVQEIQLYIMPDHFDSGFSSVAEHILNEEAIHLANALAVEDSIPYTVDMSMINSDSPHILIKKL